MKKLIFLLVVFLFTQTHIYAQIATTAFASTSVDIIHPVGTENSGDLLSGVFIPRKEAGIVAFNKSNAGNDSTDLMNFDTPSFKIAGSQFVYSITFTYDAFIVNRNVRNETIPVESLFLLPVYDKETEQIVSDKFTIGARFKVGDSQVPGIYSSAGPCRITINFN